jgi:hypothetical protein
MRNVACGKLLPVRRVPDAIECCAARLRAMRGAPSFVSAARASKDIKQGMHAWGLHQVRDTMTTRPDGTLYHWQVIRFASGREHKQAAKQAEDMS